MEMFNTHRRDILNFDSYMDLKKPGFGGPNSAMPLKDARGKLTNKNPKLSGYQRVVERDPAFSHRVYDPTYKAMTHDVVYKQEKKKPFTYTDPYQTAIPVIEVEPLEEGKSYASFTKFISEALDYELEDEMREDNPDDWNDEDEEALRAEGSSANDTFSNLGSIEDKLRRFETGESFDRDDEDFREFGANPMDDTPFGPAPAWVKELQDEEYSEDYEEDDFEEFGAGPGSCRGMSPGSC
jgi:hypothetical protein